MITLTPSTNIANSYSLNWSAQQSHILSELGNLVGQDDLLLTDVTLACDGEYIQAHKLVLSLCSSFFKDLFQKNRADKTNTIIILGNVTAQNVRYLLQFMYQGRVDIPSKDVDSFLQAGNMLKIEGLIGNVPGSAQVVGSSTTTTSTEASKPVPATRSSRSFPPPGPASKKAAMSANRDSPTVKKVRISVQTTSSSRQPTPHDDQGEQSIDADPDPLDDAGQYIQDDDVDGDVEEDIDFNNVKTEPIHVYEGGYEEGDQSEMMQGEEDSYGESGEDSYGLPPSSNVSLSAPVAVPGPSTSSFTVTRPRGNMPVILNGRYFQVVKADESRVIAKCMVCLKVKKKETCISGRFSTNSNFLTHLKRKHPKQFEEYGKLSVTVGAKKGFRRSRKEKIPEKKEEKKS